MPRIIIASGSFRTTVRTLVVTFAPVLELLAERGEEAAGEGTVDETVVVRERDVHDRPNPDHVLAELVRHDPRPLDERIGAEDPGLRLADHRRAVEGAVAAGIRDREGAALDVVRHQLLLARTLRDLGDPARDPEQVEALRVLEHRHDQALAVRELDGEAEVDVVAGDDLVAADLA